MASLLPLLHFNNTPPFSWLRSYATRASRCVSHHSSSNRRRHRRTRPTRQPPKNFSRCTNEFRLDHAAVKLLHTLLCCRPDQRFPFQTRYLSLVNVQSMPANERVHATPCCWCPWRVKVASPTKLITSHELFDRPTASNVKNRSLRTPTSEVMFSMQCRQT